MKSESEFEIDDGGAQRFRIIPQVEAGSVGFLGAATVDEALLKTDFPAGGDGSDFPANVTHSRMNREDGGVLIAVGFEVAEIIVAGHVAPGETGAKTGLPFKAGAIFEGSTIRGIEAEAHGLDFGATGFSIGIEELATDEEVVGDCVIKVGANAGGLAPGLAGFDFRVESGEGKIALAG